MAIETYYRQSEQRPARFFQTGEEEFALVSAHPDYDETWFESLTTDKVACLAATEAIGELEKRVYRWHCGCNQKRMLEVLAPVFRQDAAELFGGGETVELRCPRCSARHTVTREAMEAFVADAS
jgi:molecular chaperone Hsp33